MKTSWTAGLKEDKKIEIIADFKSCPALRARLEDILTKKIDSLRKENLSKESYSSPSWAYAQADGNGYERGLKEVISLISSIDVEN